MDISTYRPLISKVLSRCSGKGLTPDQVAAAICERIVSFEEDMALMGGKPLVIQGPTKQPGDDAYLEGRAIIERTPQVDISDRIEGSTDGQMIERWSKEQLLDFAKNQMPSVLLVKPPDYEQAFEINKFVESAPGDLGFVNIIYQPPGGRIIDNQRIGPTERISTTDKILDADALTDSIRKQANALYTKTKKVLTPRQPVFDPGALVANIPGDKEREAAELAGAPGGTMPMDGALSSQWKAQRR